MGVRVPMEQIEAHLRSHLDDRESWLVYGDWLLDREDERGRLVALEHRAGEPELPDGERRALQGEIDEVVERYQERWLERLPDDTKLRMRHGFVVGVELPWSAGAAAGLGELLAHEDGRLLASLRVLSGSLDSRGLARLLTLDLGRLVALDLRYSWVGADGARALAECAALAGLASLDLGYADIGDDGVRALAGSPHLAGLSTLRLPRDAIGPEGAAALASSEHLRRLTVLDLRHDPIGPEGAAALAASPIADGLASLHLHRKDVGDEGARALAGSARLPVHIRRFWRGR